MMCRAGSNNAEGHITTRLRRKNAIQRGRNKDWRNHSSNLLDLGSCKHRAFGVASRDSRSYAGGITQVAPLVGEVGAEFFAGHGAFGQAFDFRAALSRDALFGVYPFVNGDRCNAKRFRYLGSKTVTLADIGFKVHAANDKVLPNLRQEELPNWRLIGKSLGYA